MKKLVLLAALLSGTTAVAQAEELMYGGLGLGYATQKLDVTNVDQKSGKVAGKIYLGYQFNENLALEGAYHYLNKTTVKTLAGEDKTKGHLFGLTINGMLPVNEQFSLLGKAGIAAYHSRYTKVEDTAKKTAAAPIIGVGAEFKVNKELALRGEYEYFGKPKVGHDSKMKRLDMFTISLRSTF